MSFRSAPQPDNPSRISISPACDHTAEKPVPNETFEIFLSMYLYDGTGLDPKVEATDDSSSVWRKQKVTFRTAYCGARMAAYSFLPSRSEDC